MAKCAGCNDEIPRGKGYRVKGKKSPLLCRNCWKKRPRNWQILLGIILMTTIILPLVWLKHRIRT